MEEGSDGIQEKVTGCWMRCRRGDGRKMGARWRKVEWGTCWIESWSEMGWGEDERDTLSGSHPPDPPHNRPPHACLPSYLEAFCSACAEPLTFCPP